ncbi:MAG: helix-turn-helix transcriptional regulator [Roseivivax sp.]|nr:helix-turn-helix transcriptional regulator [Roseivivax sp.]
MSPKSGKRPVALLLMITAQTLCAVFFVWDVLSDAVEDMAAGLPLGHLWIEAAAVAGLVAAILFETRYLLRLLRRKAHLERQVSLAATAFHDIIEDHCRRWGLTASEQDVATFTIKGLSIAEIAALRGTAEGTVKAHLNGIYRKAGVTGRGALLSLLIEELMGQPLLSPDRREDTDAA